MSKQRLSQVLFDQSRFIKTFAMSKEGDMAITGDESGQVNLWNLLDGELIDTIIEPRSEANKIGICKVALSHSHLLSVTAFSNNSVNVYDNEMGDVVSVFNEHQSPVKHLYVLDDNRKILSSDGYNLIKIWLAHSGQLLESITVACNMFGLSPDMKYVVSGPGENSVKIWSLADAKVIRTIDHPEKICIIVFTLDSQFVITGGEDNSCKIWELSTGKLIQVLIDHDGPITSIAVPYSNNIVVSGSKDKLVIIWNFKHGSVNHKLNFHHDIIVKVAVTYDGNVVISASRDSVINVWSAKYGYLLTSINLQFTLADLLVSINGNRMIARFEDSSAIPIIGLTHKWSTKEYQRTFSQSNLKSPEYIIKNEIFHNNVLPIKPKPLIFPKKSSNLAILFSNNAIPNHTARTRKYSDVTSNIQNEAISTSQNSSSRGLFQKPKRKTKKSSDFSSTASMINNNDEKHKKTKICCLI